MSTALIVDDSRFARTLIRKGVQALLPEYQVVEAASGEEAVEALATLERGLDVAILDYNMPGMNGLELARQIEECIPSVHMVLCTANIQDAIANKACELGLAVMDKPFTEDKFREYLRETGQME